MIPLTDRDLERVAMYARLRGADEPDTYGYGFLSAMGYRRGLDEERRRRRPLRRLIAWLSGRY